MTKLKSLVTVTVDNVFRNFPIDEERYELFEEVERMEADLFFGSVLKVPQVGNSRIKCFLEGTVANFALGAISVARVNVEPHTGLPNIVHDRARRAAASISSWDTGYDLTVSFDENVRLTVWCLWSNFRDALLEAHIKLGQEPRVELVRKLSKLAFWNYLIKSRSVVDNVPADRELQS